MLFERYQTKNRISLKQQKKYFNFPSKCQLQLCRKNELTLRMANRILNALTAAKNALLNETVAAAVAVVLRNGSGRRHGNIPISGKREEGDFLLCSLAVKFHVFSLVLSDRIVCIDCAALRQSLLTTELPN